jgi:hypothetical protein
VKESSPPKLTHPVWEVYDELRETLLFIKYYSIKLNKIKKINFILEFLLGILSPSLLAGLWFFNSPDGQQIMKILLVIPASFSVIKTIINLQENISKIERALSHYQIYHNDLHMLKIKITNIRKYNEELKSEFLFLANRYNYVGNITNEPIMDKKLIKRLQIEVDTILPSNHFFIPNEDI